MNVFHPLTLGTLSIKGNIIQAPLASYSDRAYRHLCQSYGSPLAVSEMVSAEGLLREGEKTLSLLALADTERDFALKEESEKIPFAVQLFGSKPLSFFKATEVLLKHMNPPLIDINAACPVKKVMKTGSGSSLMHSPKLIGEIIRAVKEAGAENVSIKIRLGISEASMNYLEVAEEAFNSGAVALSMHTRTANALYSGTANHAHTKILKDHFKDRIIIASGDIQSRRIAKSVMEETGADAVHAARGAIGNPFIFCEGEENISPQERIKAFLQHIDLAEYYKDTPLKELRKFAPYYTKHLSGIPGVKEARLKICTKALTKEDYQEALSLIRLF